MTKYKSFNYTTEQVEELVWFYNEIIKKNLKEHFLGVKKFVPSIDNGKGWPAKEIYIGVDLDKKPASTAPIHEAFSFAEKMLKKDHKIKACYYIRTAG